MTEFFTIYSRDMVLEQCPTCSVEYAIPRMAYDKAKQSSGPNGRSIYCPNGHSWHYIGETEAEKQRHRADLLAQQIAQRDDEIAGLEKSVSAHKGQITKLKKRASVGVCPCCNRSFRQLSRHMQNKHPAYVEEQGGKVVPMKPRKRA